MTAFTDDLHDRAHNYVARLGRDAPESLYKCVFVFHYVSESLGVGRAEHLKHGIDKTPAFLFIHLRHYRTDTFVYYDTVLCKRIERDKFVSEDLPGITVMLKYPIIGAFYYKICAFMLKKHSDNRCLRYYHCNSVADSQISL